MSTGDEPAGPVAGEHSEDAVSPPPGNPRFSAVDGVRCIAATCVLVFHLAQSSNVGQGQTGPAALFAAGVGVFFVVSAFLLYRPFVAARMLNAPPIHYLPFAWRRVLRIVPLFWFVLTFVYLTAPWSSLTERSDFFTGAPWWQYYLFGQIYTSASSLGAIGQAWTLDVEFSFYLLLPVWAGIFSLLSRAGIGFRWEVAALLSAGVLSFGQANSWAGTDDQYLLRTLLGTFYLFVPGMIFALLSVEGQRRGDCKPALLLERYASSAWIVAASVLVLGPVIASPGFTTFGAIIFAATVPLPAFFARIESVPNRILSLPTLAWGGLISYGIYLWHRQVILGLERLGLIGGSLPVFAAMLLVVFAVTMAVSAFTYRFVERPVLRFKRRTFSASAEP